MFKQVQEDSSIPLYQQVSNDLRAAIEHEIYRVGQKIPTEPELSQLYGVSRITVRRAIEQLAKEGWLVKRQGRGTFVTSCEPAQVICDDRSIDVRGFSASCRANGRVPGGRIIRQQRTRPTSEEALFFAGCSDDAVIAIDRLRTADGRPIMVEHNLFARAGLEFLETANLVDVSLFDLIFERTHRRPRRSSMQSLSILRADERFARLLEVPIGEPLFYLVGRYLDQHGTPLYLGRQYIIGSQYTFSM